MSKMKASEFVAKLKDIAQNYKTLYVMGCFGAPMSATNKTRYCNNHDYNKQAARTAMIKAASADTFGFDCVCLIKGVLWGWCGDKSKTYGGAKYACNDVPDIGADQMITKCPGGGSTDFSNIEVGEALWTNGHIGVYIGDGLGIECTPAWKNKVQVTAVANIGKKSGYNARNWKKHGKLPYIEYDVRGSTAPAAPAAQVSAATDVTNPAKYIWTFLTGKLGNPYAVGGIMGNLYAESGLRANNLQNTSEKKLGMTDAEYTAAVDNGSYTNFVRDSGGYGIAQWTYWSRKENLLKYARSQGKSIGDLPMQLDFLWNELGSYGLQAKLKATKSVREASDIMLLEFEKPANQGEAVKAQRAGYGQKYYDDFAGTSQTTPVATSAAPAVKPSTKIDYAQSFDKTLAGPYKVTAQGGLNLRAGCSTAKSSLMVMPYGTVVNNYGYYSTAANGVKWLYVKTKDGTIGFCSSNFLART